MIIKEWIKGSDVDSLKQALADIQAELFSRAFVATRIEIGLDHIPIITQAQAAEEWAKATATAPGKEIRSVHAPTFSSIAMEEHDKTEFRAAHLLNSAEDVAGNVCYPYLLANVEIPSCPVIGKEQLKGDPLDFEGMEI